MTTPDYRTRIAHPRPGGQTMNLLGPKNLTIGERIRAARRYRGMTGGEFADRLGISQACVSRWEHNHRLLPVSRLSEIATILNVPLSYFTDDNTLIAKLGRQYPGTWHNGRL